jgi:anti-sigma factor RsiW
MQCAESTRLQAYFDGELDAPSAAEIERHSAACAECCEVLTQLGEMRTALREDVAYSTAPPALRSRIMRALDQESPLQSPGPEGKRPSGWRLRPFWAGAFSGICASAVAASLIFAVMAPPLINPLLDDLVNAHERSLMPDHLIDVVSTDKHTVKPWFSGHADVSPVVADFAQQGYRLAGGRADYFDNQRAAVVVYQHGSHVINVFSWAVNQGGLPKNTTRNGYHLVFWRIGNIEYCAVSDAGMDEINRLVQLLQDLGARDNRG